MFSHVPSCVALEENSDKEPSDQEVDESMGENEWMVPGDDFEGFDSDTDPIDLTEHS